MYSIYDYAYNGLLYLNNVMRAQAALTTDDLLDYALSVEVQALQHLAETTSGASFAQRYSANHAEPMCDSENHRRTGGR